MRVTGVTRQEHVTLTLAVRISPSPQPAGLQSLQEADSEVALMSR